MSKKFFDRDFIFGFIYVVFITLLTFTLIWLTSIISNG